MTDQGYVAKIKLLHHHSQIIAQGIIVVAASGIPGAAMPAMVVGDAAIATIGKMDHLVLPQICIHGPAVNKENRFHPRPIP